MELTETALAAKARRSYETGRLRASIGDGWPLLPITALGLFEHRGAAWLQVGCLALFGLVVAFSWRGQGWARGVWAGYLVGIPPLLLPALASRGWACCIGGRCLPACMLLCPVAGLAAGALAGRLAARAQRERASFAIACTAVAASMGLIGCSVAGAWGLLGMAAGGLAGAVPTYVGRRARAT